MVLYSKNTINGKKIHYYIQLLEVFTYREVKSRYRSSLIGPIWIIIYPLMTAILLNFVFGYFIKIDTRNIPYLPFLFTGLIFWNFFQQGLFLAKDSLVWNRELIIKTAFPKSILPVSYVLSKVPDFIVNSIILFIMTILSGYKIEISVLLIFLELISVLLFTIGVALIVSYSNAIFRDFGRIFDFLLLLMFYGSTIVYSDFGIPQSYKFIIYVNPLSLLIIFLRSILFENKIRIELLLLSFLLGFSVLLISAVFSSKIEKKVVDLI